MDLEQYVILLLLFFFFIYLFIFFALNDYDWIQRFTQKSNLAKWK